MVAASLAVEPGPRVRRLQQLQLPGSKAQAQQLRPSIRLLCGIWDLPRSGIKPVSPALAGRFLTTEPLGKPNILRLGNKIFFNIVSTQRRVVHNERISNILINSLPVGWPLCFNFLLTFC